jgi:SNF2 family DNA or RNA helicase
MMILKGLMQLRLIANHPLMFSDEQMIRSGKFEAVMQRLETLKHENRKVLVFSQFVKHLKIYQDEFESRGWKYSMLIGSTTNRSDVVNEFEQHEGFCVFLISLKAGGVGLNLVSADVVFLLDPWWNPAVESQAISRAHRIGQDKPVHVYRFISRETIEEKIIKLQERKRNLAKNILVDSSFMASLSDDELRELVD